MPPLNLIPNLSLAPTATIDDARVGAELTALYQEAEVSILRFGAAFYAVEKIVNATRGVNSEEGFAPHVARNPKGGRPKGGFKLWLRTHAPEIAETTARRYRDIAEAVATKFKIADPVRFFTLPASALDAGDQKKRLKVLDFCAEKSVRGLQLELGLVTAPTGIRGGARTPLPRSKAEQAALAAAPVEIPGDWHWPTEADRAHFTTLSPNQRHAWIEWMPRVRVMHNALADPRRHMLADLDSRTKDMLLANLDQLRPWLTKRA